MAKFKVSYKVLGQQGEELKAVAKLVDGYSERVSTISGRLGEGEMLAEVRQNLQKLITQMGESRTILNVAGELLTKTVESYTSTEARQVKKVDNLKAHNRDFYKNPVVVASAGGTTVVSDSSTTVNYTANTTVYNAPSPEVTPVASAAPVAEAVPVAAVSQDSGVGKGLGVTAGAGIAGGAAASAAVMGAAHLSQQQKEKPKKDDEPPEEDPEQLLADAMERARRLREEE